MSSFQPTCPKCQGQMLRGFVADFGYDAAVVSSWTPGDPQKSFWTGLKVPEKIPIGTFRCSSCGYLESYAREEFERP
jgi:predicted nucleic-acid-binding Zn-ribbon protein